MRSELRSLTALELKSQYGINRLHHTKDRKEKRNGILLSVVWVLLAVLVAGYVGGLSYLLITAFGLSHLAIPYLVMISALFVFIFGVFRTGTVIFSKKGYDVLCSLPVRASSIVLSRFLPLYITDVVLTLLIIVPGVVVYGICLQPTVGFYLAVLVGALFVPMIPLVVTTILGTLISAAAVRMRHKNLVQTALTLVFVLVVLLLSFGSGSMGDMSLGDMAVIADTVAGIIETFYPPALWLGAAALGDVVSLLLFVLVSVAAGALMLVVVTKNFHAISRKLFATSAKHNYEMEALRSRGVLAALYRREAKRYFSSSICVVNTIIGPIMALIFSIAILVVGVETVQSVLPFDIVALLPFALAAIFTMMTTTAVSISMEGKEFWIVKTLPIPAKTLFDSKILLNLSLILPFYLVSEVLLFVGVQPSGFDVLMCVAVPAVVILFAVVFGIWINLRLHSFDWENEAAVVKQSASSMIGGFAGVVVALVGLVAVLLFGTVAAAVVCVAVGAVTVVLYRKNNRVDLSTL